MKEPKSLLVLETRTCDCKDGETVGRSWDADVFGYTLDGPWLVISSMETYKENGEWVKRGEEYIYPACKVVSLARVPVTE